jgi:hypothetical protein
MQAKKSMITLSPFEIEDSPSITSIKLIETKQGVQLLLSTTKAPAANAFGYETVILSIPIADDEKTTSRLFVIPQLLPPPPDWDAAVNPDNSYSLVFQSAGGATDNILVMSTDDPVKQTPVPATYPFESFSNPSFVKRYEEDPGRLISAIVDKEQAVLFLREQGGRYKKQAELCTCSYAVTIKYQNAFMLLHKVEMPGPVRGNDIVPGALYHARLGKDFSPIEAAVESFPGHTIFEFGVDALGDRIAIFATAKEGTFLALGSSLTEPLEIIALEEDLYGEMFSRPAVLITESHIYLAILEDAQTEKARLLMGAFPVPRKIFK